jgi:hypothetical protein
MKFFAFYFAISGIVMAGWGCQISLALVKAQISSLSVMIRWFQLAIFGATLTFFITSVDYSN